jgi:Mn-containing catalase
MGEVAYQFWNNSDGQGAKGRWADGPSPDGKGTFTTVDPVRPLGEVPILGAVDPRVHGSRRDQAPLMDRAGEAVSTAAETIRRAAE